MPPVGHQFSQPLSSNDMDCTGPTREEASSPREVHMGSGHASASWVEPRACAFGSDRARDSAEENSRTRDCTVPERWGRRHTAPRHGVCEP